MAYDDGEGTTPAPLEEPQVATTAPCWRCGGKGWVGARAAPGSLGSAVHTLAPPCPACEGTGVKQD